MPRTPEPAELMDEAAQAEAYARADFADVNDRFVRALLERFPELRSGRVIDLGCGPADIPIRLARQRPGLRITAVDGSPSMLAHAARAVREHHLEDRVELRCALLAGGAPGAGPGRGERYDAVISNSLLHHLYEPAVLWAELRALARTNAPVFVVDLMRPESPEAARAIVEAYSAGEPEVLRRDFYNSLLAAFTPDEIRAQLAAAELPLQVVPTSDRHLAIFGRAP